MASTAAKDPPHRNHEAPGMWNFIWNLLPRDQGAAGKLVNPKRESVRQGHRSRRVIVKKPSRTLLVNLNDSGFEANTFISSMQLSMWDNISGPRVEQVWTGSETIPEELQLYTARHTLCGVVGQPDQDASKIETKFHVNSEQGYLITSTIFSATYLGSTSKFSLSILIKQNFLHKYLVLNAIVEDRLYKLVLKLQATLNKNQDGLMEQFTKELGQFCANLEVLFAVQDLCGLPSSPRTNRTYTNPTHPHQPFHSQSSSPNNISLQSFPPPESRYNRARLPSPTSSTSSLFSSPREPFAHLRNTLFFSAPQDKQFVIRAITSHLQTHGSTVVTGPNIDLVNMYVESLSMFLGPSPKEKKRVGLADPKREYTADLLLQGIVGHGVKLIDDSVLPNMLPTTWIDLEHHTIKQTPPFHEYGLLRKHFGDSELGQFIGVPDVAAAQSLRDLLKDGLFKAPKPEILSSPLVARMINEVYDLPAALREACVSQGFRLLLRKASVMIKFVEAELNKNHLPEEIGEEVRTRVQENLNLTKGDFAVLLGLAEKLKPKFYVTLVGDPSIIQEKFKDGKEERRSKRREKVGRERRHQKLVERRWNLWGFADICPLPLFRNGDNFAKGNF
eukprot:Phypoly_transcript_04336.p1 GENE.Phypoly_transcript_04336~~Phypoly_transcript_04336.p1  ORF type:complete len:617 (+),score=85.46 Phypoly_transcript_04336:52-1902(+)